MQKPYTCSIFHNNDSKKKVVRQIDSKVVCNNTTRRVNLWKTGYKKVFIGGCNAIEKPMIPFKHLHSWKCYHRTMMQMYSILGVNGLYNNSRR